MIAVRLTGVESDGDSLCNLIGALEFEAKKGTSIFERAQADVDGDNHCLWLIFSGACLEPCETMIIGNEFPDVEIIEENVPNQH